MGAARLAVPAAVLAWLLCPAVGDRHFGEPAKYGDKDFWVLLKDIQVSEGRLWPSFDPEATEFDVHVSNPAVQELTLTLRLDNGKYYIEYPPLITVDDQPVKYRLIDPISVHVALNDTVGPFEKTLKIKISDPKGENGWFEGAAEHVYKVRILQPPEYDKLVRANALTVVGADGQIIKSSPPFRPDSDNVNYRYSLKDINGSVQVAVACPESSNGQTYDGEPVDFNASTTVPIDDAVTSMLAQCTYRDKRWTKDHTFQRTYVLTFSREADLANTRVHLRIIPTQGYCDQPDTEDTSHGFTCRADRKSISFIVDYNSSMAEVMLVGARSESYRLYNGLPTVVHVGSGHRHHYTLTMKAGHSSRKYPLQLILPAACWSHYVCPLDWVSKSRSSTAARDRLCGQEVCDESDTERCCDKGPSYSVDMKSVGLRYNHVWRCVAKHLHVDDVAAKRVVDATPAKVMHGVNRMDAMHFAKALRVEGAHVEVSREHYSAFDVELGDVAGAARTDVMRVLQSSAFMSPHEARAALSRLPALVARSVRLSTAKQLAQRLHRAGCAARILGSSLIYNVIVKRTGPNTMAIVRYVAKLMHSAQGAAFDALDPARLPAEVQNGVPIGFASKVAKDLEHAGATVEVERHALAATCDAFDCPPGTALAFGARSLRCKGRRCEEDDSRTCCVEASACSQFVCPMGFAHNNATVVGEHLVCRKYLVSNCLDVCCFEVPMCDSFRCPDGYASRDWAAARSCEARSCSADVCCIPLPVCRRDAYKFPCPKGTALKDTAAKIIRPIGFNLEPADCCEPRAPCDTYTCPDGFVSKDEAPQLECLHSVCGPNDTDICCRSAGVCLGFPCPPWTALREFAATRLCHSRGCEVEDNVDVCCEPTAACDKYVDACPPRHILRRNASNFACRAAMCTEADDAGACCEARANCSTFECPANHSLRFGASGRTCRSFECGEIDVPTCCEERKPCPEFSCPRGSTLRREFWDEWHVEGSVEECCEATAACDSYSCPAGFQTRAAARHSSRLRCAHRFCTDADAGVCCEASKRNVRHQVASSPVRIVVRPRHGQGKCDKFGHGFWCIAFGDAIDLSVYYHRGVRARVRHLGRVQVPPKGQTAKHLTVLVRDGPPATSKLNIWVARDVAPSLLNS